MQLLFGKTSRIKPSYSEEIAAVRRKVVDEKQDNRTDIVSEKFFVEFLVLYAKGIMQPRTLRAVPKCGCV